MTSVSLGPAGSAGDSPRPSRDTTFLTSGAPLMIFIARISIFRDSSSEMFGTRSMFGEMEPSAISGIKEVPRKGNKDNANANKASTDRMVVFGWPNVQ